MPTDRSYIALNDASRARLEAFVRRCSDADLAKAMPAGWTVAAVLAHVAFWDERASLLAERWEQQGVAPTPVDGAHVDWINDAPKPMFLALPPRRAAELALVAAEAADRRMAALSDEMIARNASAGSPLTLLRAEHRREHLDEIEHVLGR
ncbi:MAG TPA: DinB family protein [Methylomirabilota bacterium]|jgi:hypothetical protein|nr:DinB family protein [Methylomirabilota bacterium]